MSPTTPQTEIPRFFGEGWFQVLQENADGFAEMVGLVREESNATKGGGRAQCLARPPRARLPSRSPCNATEYLLSGPIGVKPMSATELRRLLEEATSQVHHYLPADVPFFAYPGQEKSRRRYRCSGWDYAGGAFPDSCARARRASTAASLL